MPIHSFAGFQPYDILGQVVLGFLDLAPAGG